MSIRIPTENDVKAACKAMIEARGGLCIRVNSGAFAGEYKGRKRFVRLNSEEGCADLLCCIRGRWVSVETKRKGGRTDPKRLIKQAGHAARVTMAGGLALTVRSAQELEADLIEAGVWTDRIQAANQRAAYG